MTAHAEKQTQAGRLRLAARLELARHGADLLHSKEEALQRERSRLQGHVDRTARGWEAACGDAATWLLRARALGASGELAALISAKPGSATVTAEWRTSMGVTYPGALKCEPGPAPATRATAALVPTTLGYQVALQAGADHASTTTALQRLTAELAQTRRRKRAIEHRLIPQLQSQLHDLTLHLDEQDRDEALRVRIAMKKTETSIRS